MITGILFSRAECHQYLWLLFAKSSAVHISIPAPIDKDVGYHAHLRDPIAASSFYHPVEMELEF